MDYIMDNKTILRKIKIGLKKQRYKSYKLYLKVK